MWVASVPRYQLCVALIRSYRGRILGNPYLDAPHHLVVHGLKFWKVL
jgi:hypothetical protein